MKNHCIILLGITGVVVGFPASSRGADEQKVAEETRLTLRQQGFKTDLAEFDFSATAEFSARADALIKADIAGDGLRGKDYTRRYVLFQDSPALMPMVGPDSAVVIWNQKKLQTYYNDDIWSALAEALNPDGDVLDAACTAALSGPLRFDLNVNDGRAMLLRHLGSLRSVTRTLGLRAVFDLHTANKGVAWTNLLALTRLVTAWSPESVDVSHLVRFDCSTIAYDATWQVLQAEGWTDDRLAELQREWENVEFFKGLADTAAFARASMVATCQLERQEPLRDGATAIELRYRNEGTYEDEKALLLHYRDRELEIQRAIQCTTWSEMRQLPGVTNFIPFRSKHSSRMQMMMNTKQMGFAMQLRGQGVLGRAADAEIRRRLIITAIALERYRNRNRSYPKVLQEIAPEFLKAPPQDFVDGKPLRYRVTDDGHFVLYSVGLDCRDDGGTMPQSQRRTSPLEERQVQAAVDIVWPRPASTAESVAEEKRHEEEKQAIIQKEKAREEQEEARRRATVEKLLSTKPAARLKEPEYEGQPLSRILRNDGLKGGAQLTLDEMLALKQIATGSEPDIATFELGISYDVVTNIGVLRLMVDAEPEEGSDSRGGELQACRRATNGNCLLIWNTTYDPPGQHAVQARLWCIGKANWRTFEVRGPVAPFNSTNICQFDPFYSQFDSKGATLYAKLAEPVGTYTIELKSPAGDIFRRFTGTTSNGVIDVHWDLTDGHGRIYTNDSVNTVFHVTLPGSGRSQTQKGP
jgi:hypothetical protein